MTIGEQQSFKLDGKSLRISVADVCNMTCHYCPRHTSMENFTPPEYLARRLSNPAFYELITNLGNIASFATVSLTGGEPLTRPDLDQIAATTVKAFGHCELTTNGLLLNSTKWRSLSHHISRVKISLDTLDPELFCTITGVSDQRALQKVIAAITMIKNEGKELAINAVVTRRTLPGIWALLDWALDTGLRVHLLDYYYSDERRDDWINNFVVVDNLLEALSKRYGPPNREDRFGCEFFMFSNSPGSIVRVKRSTSATMRAAKCANCKIYCQEGLYGLKLSIQGWLTTCPSLMTEHGVLCDPEWSPKELAMNVSHLFHDLKESRPNPVGFDNFLVKRGLTPLNYGKLPAS